MSLFTDEQMRVILGSDIGGQEDELLRQQRLAQSLRGMGQNNRMDWGSQLARAASGLGAGYMDYKAGKAAEGLGQSRRKMLEELFGSGGAGAPTGLA